MCIRDRATSSTHIVKQMWCHGWMAGTKNAPDLCGSVKASLRDRVTGRVRAMALQEARTYADINAVIGGYLRDLAFAQSSQPRMFGYKRAAAAILALDVPLPDLAGPDGTLPRIPGIGPGSTRIIREILETGSSPTVERAIDD